MTPKQFSVLIDEKVKQKSMSHMDAVLEYCEEKNLESDFMAVLDQLLDPSKQEQMSINLKKLAKPNATAEIVNLVEDLLQE